MSSSMKARFEEMGKRLSEHNLTGSTDDQELTDRKHLLIIEGASKVLFEKGFHGASMRDVAKACGMSFGQLYHYISSKDDILYLLHKHMQKIWYEHLASSGFDSITDPLERFYLAVRRSTEFISLNRDLILFLYSESKYLGRDHLKLVLDIDNKNIVDFYRHLISELPHTTLTDYEKEIGANLTAFVQVFLALRGWNVDASRTTEQIDFMVAFICRGLGLPAPGESGK